MQTIHLPLLNLCQKVPETASENEGDTPSQIYPDSNWNSKLNTKLRLEFQVEYRLKLEFQFELLIRRESVDNEFFPIRGHFTVKISSFKSVIKF